MCAGYATEAATVTRKAIATEGAPAAIGTYSQAIRAGGWVFLSGQIGLDPATGERVEGGAEAEAHRVFANLKAVAEAAGGTLADIVKLTVYLTDLGDYATVNKVMEAFFHAPFPARAAVEVAALPRGVCVEVEGIMIGKEAAS
jgi:reactive intermediate/imine deaminase